jgi:hypothetical protein
MGAVAFGAILFAVLLAVIAVMMWQEVRKAPDGATAVYVLDDAASFVDARLPAEISNRLPVGDIHSILEWGLFHKQTVAPRNDDAPPVIGGEDSVTYVAERALAPDGARYERTDIAAILELEAEYLVSIGAVGPPVGDEVSS